MEEVAAGISLHISSAGKEAHENLKKQAKRMKMVQHILQLKPEVTSFYPSRTSTAQRQACKTSLEWYLKEMRTVCRGLVQSKEL
jgi:hypothetical protein